MLSPWTNKGYVYVIGNKDLTKIGMTTDLKRRMKELKPDKIYATAWISGYESLEKRLHAKYANSRIPQTEYFRLSEYEIELLVLELERIQEAEQKKTLEEVNARRMSGKEETDQEFLQSMPDTMTRSMVESRGRLKAHDDYLLSLSWKQKLFKDHSRNSANFLKWYEEHRDEYETEEAYKRLYQENEDTTKRFISMLNQLERKEKRNRGRRY